MNNDSASVRDDFFREIYGRYRTYLFAVCYHILNDEYDAEDTLQEVFVKIYKNMDKIYDVESNRTKSMLIIIARNTAIDFYRKKKRRYQVEMNVDDVAEYVSLDECVGVEDVGLYASIQRLPEKYRDVILLKYASAFSNEEIADILNISLSNVRKRLSRGKKYLEKLLQENGGI